MYGWAGPIIDAVPEDPGYPVAGVDYDPALLGGPVVFPQEVGSDLDRYTIWERNTRAPAASSPTQWLNANAGKVALGVGGLFVVLLLAKAGR